MDLARGEHVQEERETYSGELGFASSTEPVIRHLVFFLEAHTNTMLPRLAFVALHHEALFIFNRCKCKDPKFYIDTS